MLKIQKIQKIKEQSKFHSVILICVYVWNGQTAGVCNIYSFVIDHEKQMKIQLLNAVMLRGLGFPFEQMREDKAPSTSIRIFWICKFFFADSKISPSKRIRVQIKFARPHVYGFILVPRTPLGILATRACVVKRAKFASRIMAESAQISKKNAKSKVDFPTGNRENPGTGLPSWIHYSR